MTMVDFDMLREEMRGLDGDLYLCHLFAPPTGAMRADAVLLLCRYCPHSRLSQRGNDWRHSVQWWRDLLDAAAKGDDRGAPIGQRLLSFP